MDLENAIGKHAEWKMKFRSAISRQEQMDIATISKDNCCELGKWLHGEGAIKLGHLGSHGECVKKHKVFHSEAGKVATAINAKKYTEAETMISGQTSYANASNEVGIAIMRLKKESGL